MSDYKTYLQGRIKELSNHHAQLKLSEEQITDDEQVSMAYNSQASCVWDIKCELKKALAEYAACHPEAFKKLPFPDHLG